MPDCTFLHCLLSKIIKISKTASCKKVLDIYAGFIYKFPDFYIKVQPNASYSCVGTNLTVGDRYPDRSVLIDWSH